MANGKFCHRLVSAIGVIVSVLLLISVQLSRVPAAHAASLTATVESIIIVDSTGHVVTNRLPQSGDIVTITITLTSDTGAHYPNLVVEINNNNIDADTCSPDLGSPPVLNNGQKPAYSCTFSYEIPSPPPNDLVVAITPEACSNNAHGTTCAPDYNITAGPSSDPGFSIPVGSSPLQLVKTVDPQVLLQPGTVTYLYTITNTSIDSSVSDVNIIEDQTIFTGDASKLILSTCDVTSGSVITMGLALGSILLKPGDHADCSATYDVTSDDFAKKRIVNTATATGNITVGSTQLVVSSNQDSATIETAQLTLTKEAYAIQYDGQGSFITDTPIEAKEQGDVIKYRLVVSNMGSVDLQDVNIEDQFVDRWNCFNGGVMDPGAADNVSTAGPRDMQLPFVNVSEITCFATHTVTADEVDPSGQCQVPNTATAYGSVDLPGSEYNGTFVNAVPASAPVQVKSVSASLFLEIDASQTTATVGDTLTFTYTIENDQIELSNLQLSNPTFSGNLANLGPFICSQNLSGNLAANGTVVCTQDYKVTAADAVAGQIEITGAVSGQPFGVCDGPVEYDPPALVITPITSNGPTNSTSGSGPAGSNPSNVSHWNPPAHHPTRGSTPTPTPTVTATSRPTVAPTHASACEPQTGECATTGGSLAESRWPITAGLGLLACLAGAAYVVRRRAVQVRC